MKRKSLTREKQKGRFRSMARASFVVFVIGFLAYLGSLPRESAQAAPNSTIYFDPASITVNDNGIFSLDVVLNPGSNQVYGVDVYVDFDQTKVNATGITGNSSVFPVVLQAGSYNNGAGTASISLATGISNPPSITSPTTVATLNFQAVGSGETSISFLGNTLAIAKNEPGDVLTTKTPATVTVTSRSYGLADFQNLVNDWMENVQGSPADLNADNVVNSRDLGIMMTYWNVGAE